MLQLRENLQKLMLMHGNMSVTDLAKKTSIPQPTLHHILNGVTLKPRKEALKILSNFFSITVEQLVGREELKMDLPTNIKEQLNINFVKLIDWEGLNNLNDLSKQINLKEIYVEAPITKNSFAICARDSSMEPLFPKGSILIFDQEKELKDRDFVLVYIKEINDYLFRRILLDGKNKYIKSQNPELDTVSLTKLNLQKDKIIGILVETRIRY